MKSRKVLIVEDEGLIAFDLRRRVERIGYTVCETAVDRAEAISAAAAHSPDIALVDIRLSGSDDGIQTAVELRERFDIPVIFITAHADKATMARAMQAKPSSYIVKPFVDLDLASHIEQAIQQSAEDKKNANSAETRGVIE